MSLMDQTSKTLATPSRRRPTTETTTTTTTTTTYDGRSAPISELLKCCKILPPGFSSRCGFGRLRRVSFSSGVLSADFHTLSSTAHRPPGVGKGRRSRALLEKPPDSADYLPYCRRCWLVGWSTDTRCWSGRFRVISRCVRWCVVAVLWPLGIIESTAGR